MELQMKSIWSLVRQSTNFEIIYVDDGSNQWYRDIYKNTLSRIPLKIQEKISIYSLPWKKNQKNRVCQARNLWAQMARNNFLIFIDQETLINPYSIKNLETKVSKTVLFWPYYGYNNQKKELSSLIIKEFFQTWNISSPLFSDFRIGNKNLFESKKNWQYFCGSNFFIQKDIYFSVWGFDETIESWWDEDVEFWFRLYKSGADLKFCANIGVLNLSKKLYSFPYNILEEKDVDSLSKNCFRNIKKHSEKEYGSYVKDRFEYISEAYKKNIFPELSLFLSSFHDNA